jgi:hypothetical protein
LEQKSFFISGLTRFLYSKDEGGFRFMVFNATFNNISVISWWSVLLVEETEGWNEHTSPCIGIELANLRLDIRFYKIHGKYINIFRALKMCHRHKDDIVNCFPVLQKRGLIDTSPCIGIELANLRLDIRLPLAYIFNANL